MKAILVYLCVAGVTPLPGGEARISPQATPWMVPTADVRLRYEFADVDGLDPAHALTFRIRPSLKTRDWHGISAPLEWEFTEPLVDDYHAGAAGAEPFDPYRSTIADPRNAEINQAYGQLNRPDWLIRLGRQRIIRDNAAFVGNVRWRQNEQTYDALAVEWRRAEGIALSYAAVTRVHRIFGADADGTASDVPGKFQLLNAAWDGPGEMKMGGYAYWMDFDGGAATQGWDNRTFGLIASREARAWTSRVEVAWQEDAGPADSGSALYVHASLGHKVGSNDLTVGIEHLDEGLQTPHAFNGYADAFVASRAGKAIVQLIRRP